MALIEHCICCNLHIATSLTGVYGLIEYVIAIVLEIWWMVQSIEEVPAGGYLLCFGHFILLVLSGLLLLGAATKEAKWLLTWSAAVGTWWVPEAALAIYMSLHHWHLDEPQGKAELILWASRAVLNLGGLLCVTSQYMIWREEKLVMRRLHDLNMQASVIMESGRGPKVMTSSSNGHHNAGFTGSSPDISPTSLAVTENKVPLAAVESLVAGNKLRRTSSTGNGSCRGGERGGGHTAAVRFISSYEKAARGLSSNEFNAMAFLQHQQTAPNNAALQRARSLLELQIQKHDHWRGPALSPHAPVELIPHGAPELYTQSLDRRRMGGRRVTIGMSPVQFGTLPRGFRVPAPTLSHSNASSKTSLASQQSDDMQRYRDIAL